MRLRDFHRLLLIVLAGITTRVFTLWAGRAEFTGWLNHTYYYFVQVRGLLEQGSLPYEDMPLLFHLYAAVARAFTGLGMESETAIVASTRLIMCVVPSLIALPVYGIVKNMNGPEPLRRGQWVLVSLAAFLPLSLSYLPDFLQKNMFGLLLLSILILYSQGLLRQVNWKDASISAVLVLLIVVSHYGTSGAMVLYGVALFLAYSIVNRGAKRILLSAPFLVVGGGVATVLIYCLDEQRFRRIPRPSTVEPLFVTENIEFFKLDGPPVGWLFAGDGSWKAYSRQ